MLLFQHKRKGGPLCEAGGQAVDGGEGRRPGPGHLQVRGHGRRRRHHRPPHGPPRW